MKSFEISGGNSFSRSTPHINTYEWNTCDLKIQTQLDSVNYPIVGLLNTLILINFRRKLENRVWQRIPNICKTLIACQTFEAHLPPMTHRHYIAFCISDVILFLERPPTIHAGHKNNQGHISLKNVLQRRCSESKYACFIYLFNCILLTLELRCAFDIVLVIQTRALASV